MTRSHCPYQQCWCCVDVYVAWSAFYVHSWTDTDGQELLDQLIALGFEPDRYTCSTLLKGMHIVASLRLCKKSRQHRSSPALDFDVFPSCSWRMAQGFCWVLPGRWCFWLVIFSLSGKLCSWLKMDIILWPKGANPRLSFLSSKKLYWDRNWAYHVHLCEISECQDTAWIQEQTGNSKVHKVTRRIWRSLGMQAHPPHSPSLLRPCLECCVLPYFLTCLFLTICLFRCLAPSTVSTVYAMSG